MYCSNCNESFDGVNFCPKCGGQLLNNTNGQVQTNYNQNYQQQVNQQQVYGQGGYVDNSLYQQQNYQQTPVYQGQGGYVDNSQYQQQNYQQNFQQVSANGTNMYKPSPVLQKRLNDNSAPSIIRENIVSKVVTIIIFNIISVFASSISPLLSLISLIPAIIVCSWFFSIGNSATLLCPDRQVSYKPIAVALIIGFISAIVCSILSIVVGTPFRWIGIVIYMIAVIYSFVKVCANSYYVGKNISYAGKKYGVNVGNYSVLFLFVTIFVSFLFPIIAQVELNKFSD